MSEAILPIMGLAGPTTVVPTITRGYNIPGNAINSKKYIEVKKPITAVGSKATPKKFSYRERHGQTRFDTIMNASGQVINTVAGIVALVNEFKGGRTVYIQDSTTGEQRRATAEDMAFMESQAMAAQQAGGNVDMATIIALMNQRNAEKPKDNTALYVGIGVGVLALGGIIIMATNKKGK
ncbi:hypothetical protein [Capnocytophaga felis]|uniref:Uncharacterized protein n=1 Tax=Capnocytophaga felis TaxID=2267611 RepID=A0A5M4BBE9_9FLAO|nr:hypothetical protein [Capnocytophaga felis]GET46914.1 hypothetical protein RCZ01_22160 [Capnocytophaga felis]GET49434.1 hypothetical protein RCZ02_22650 [Capnocytophaga felis]